MGTNPKPIQTSRSNATLRLVLLSDTHQLHREVEIPDGDILIHAGDFTMFSQSMNAITDFNTWLGELPHRHKILTFGNHEFFAEVDPSKCSMLTNAVVLIDEGTEIEGLRIWGSPVTPLYGGAFGRSSAEDRRQLYVRNNLNGRRNEEWNRGFRRRSVSDEVRLVAGERCPLCPRGADTALRS
jgi:predicted phosphohydrolase